MLLFLTIFKWFRRLIYLALVAAFVYLVVCSAEVISASNLASGPAPVSNAEVVVVIGSATSHSISSDLKARCDLAYADFRLHHGRTLIVTGAASSASDPSESSVAAAYLTKKGIKGVLQTTATQIPGQLSEVLQMLPSGATEHVVLVADPLQTKWLEQVAAAVGLKNVQVDAAPAPKGGFWSDAGTIWGQAVAVGYGNLFGYKNTGWIAG